MPSAPANGLASPAHSPPAQPMDITNHSPTQAGAAEAVAPAAHGRTSSPQQHPVEHDALNSPASSPTAADNPEMFAPGADGSSAEQPKADSALDVINPELSPQREAASDVMADAAVSDAAPDAMEEQLSPQHEAALGVMAEAAIPDAMPDAAEQLTPQHEAASDVMADAADLDAVPDAAAVPAGTTNSGGSEVAAAAGADADAQPGDDAAAMDTDGMAAPGNALETAASGDAAVLDDMQQPAMLTGSGSADDDGSPQQTAAESSDSDDDLPIGTRSAVADAAAGSNTTNSSGAADTRDATAAEAAASSDDDSDDRPLGLRTAVPNATAQSPEPPNPHAAPAAKRQRTDSSQRSSGSPSPGPQHSCGSDGHSRGGGAGRLGSGEAAKPARPGSSGKKTYTLPKIKRSERCGHCHTCVNPQLKQACLTVRARMEAEARARGEASPPVSAGLAAAAKRAGSSLASDGPEPDTPFYRGLKAILGRSGGVESDKRVAPLEKLMANHAKDLEKRKLLVRVIGLSSGAAKAVLADGGGVATIGSWLLEAAGGGKEKFAAELLECLDGLPIGMKALRAGIGKTVQKVRKMPAEGLHRPAAALVAKWKKGLEAEKATAAEPDGGGGGGGGGDSAPAAAKRPRDTTVAEPAAKRPRPEDGSAAQQEGGPIRVSAVSDDHDMFAAPVQPRPTSAPLRKLQTGGVKVLDQDPRMATGGGGGGPPAAAAVAAGNGPSPRGTPRGRTQLAPGLDPFGAAAAVARAATSEPPSVPPAPTSDDEDDAKPARGDDGPQPTAATAAAMGRPKPQMPSITSIGTTRIGGLATGLGSLPSPAVMSQWASGAAGRAAEAAARVPSPPPAPRKPKAKTLSWVADEALAHVRFFNKHDPPVAVRANAEWAAGDEAAPAAEAEETHPPGFESAARQEHLSEAAALRGRGLAGGAADIGEVDPRQAFNERFQAMRPTMPWAPPPPTELADPQWAAGEDSQEMHEEAMRQRLRPRAPNGEAAEPPVYPPDMREDAPPRCMIPLHVPAAAAAAAAAAQPAPQPQPAPQQPPVQQHQQPQQQPAGLPAGLPPALAQLQQLLPQVSQAAAASAPRAPPPPPLLQPQQQQQQQPLPFPPQQRPPLAGIERPPQQQQHFQQQRFPPQGGPLPQQQPPFANQQQRPPPSQQHQQTAGAAPYRPVLGPDGRPLGAPPQQPGRGFGRGGRGPGGRQPPQGGLSPGVGGPGRGGPAAGRGSAPPQGGGRGGAPGPPFTGRGPSPTPQQARQQQWPLPPTQQQPAPLLGGLPGPPQGQPQQQQHQGTFPDHRAGGGGAGGRGGPQGPRNAPMVDPASGRRICLFHLTPEGCRKGDACRFAHVRAAVPKEELDHALGAISATGGRTGGRMGGGGGGGGRGPPPPRGGGGRGGRGPGGELRRGVDARFL